MTMTWKNGRQLATLQDVDNTISYEYDSDSIRTSKTVDGVKHTYAYLGGKLMYETRGDAKFYYSYDANGVLYSVKYTLTDDSDMLTYFFTHNSRGDIVGIYDSNGTQQAKYEYDAWGNILSITDANGTPITSDTHIANLNPFRYRGYYYDSETGLYYLMSRYYDPVTHRFINADGYLQASGDILDTNMSVYCRNNPVVYIDTNGEFAITCIVVGALVGGLFEASFEVLEQTISGKSLSQVDWGSVAIEGITGAISGGVAGAGVGPVASFIWDVGISAGNSIAHGWYSGDDTQAIALDILDNAISSSLFSGTQYIGWTTSQGKHYMESKASKAVRKAVNELTTPDNNTIDNVETFVDKAKDIAKASRKTLTVTYCRNCGRPIGTQYAWQCIGGLY